MVITELSTPKRQTVNSIRWSLDLFKKTSQMIWAKGKIVKFWVIALKRIGAEYIRKIFKVLSRDVMKPSHTFVKLD